MTIAHLPTTMNNNAATDPFATNIYPTKREPLGENNAQGGFPTVYAPYHQKDLPALPAKEVRLPSTLPRLTNLATYNGMQTQHVNYRKVRPRSKERFETILHLFPAYTREQFRGEDGRDLRIGGWCATYLCMNVLRWSGNQS